MAAFTYLELIDLIDKIEELDDEAKKIESLDDVLIAAAGLKTLYQAQIVKELMRDSLKFVHKMTKPQIEKAIQEAGKSSEDEIEPSEYFTRQGFNARSMRDKILEDFPPLWTLHDTLRIYNEDKGVYEADDSGLIEREIRLCT